jgi:hypothetical protein
MLRTFAAVFLMMGVLMGIRSIAQAQVVPAENSRFNYRLIGFYVPPEQLRGAARIEIAKGTHQSHLTFKQQIVVVAPATTSKNTLKVPHFGSSYTWRIVTKSKGKDILGDLHTFATLPNPDADTAEYKWIVSRKSPKLKDAYIFLDWKRGLYDLDGHLVWSIPRELLGAKGLNMTRDLKASPNSTITFMAGDRILDIDWTGLIVWTGPNSGVVSGDSSERYHHEFTKLKNGRYMVLGAEIVDLAADAKKIKDSLLRIGVPVVAPKPAHENPSMLEARLKRTQVGTIIEYDRSGAVVWSWHLYPWFRKTYVTANPVFNSAVDLHENSFFFDEANSFVYVSLKNASEVLKISYPSGEVVATFGKSYRNGLLDTTPSAFCAQHSVKRTSKGEIMLFNNNICSKNQPPSAVIFQDSLAPEGGVNVLWEFDCPVPQNAERNASTKELATSGGNVQELADGSFFISTCTPFGDMYVVDRNKHVLWQAEAKIWQASKSAWSPSSSYRATMITKQELERIIWKNSPFDLPTPDGL